jgi:hypothetical protein
LRLAKCCGTAGEENRGVTPAEVSWSRDEKFLYVHLAEADRKTWVIPLPAGHAIPPWPGSGIHTARDVAAYLAKLPGASTIPQQRAFLAADPSVYVYPQVAAHRNIYRIPVR